MKMPAWGFYKKERERFSQDIRYNLPILTQERVVQLIEVICKQYDLIPPRVTFTGRKYHKCHWHVDRINFVKHDLKLGIVCHEVAHYIRNKKYVCHRHNKALMDLIAELLDYVDQFIIKEKDKFGMKRTVIVGAEQ